MDFEEELLQIDRQIKELRGKGSNKSQDNSDFLRNSNYEEIQKQKNNDQFLKQDSIFMLNPPRRDSKFNQLNQAVKDDYYERKINQLIEKLDLGKKDYSNLMKEGEILRKNLKEFNKLIEDKLQKKQNLLLKRKKDLNKKDDVPKCQTLESGTLDAEIVNSKKELKLLEQEKLKLEAKVLNYQNPQHVFDLNNQITLVKDQLNQLQKFNKQNQKQNRIRSQNLQNLSSDMSMVQLEQSTKQILQRDLILQKNKLEQEKKKLFTIDEEMKFIDQKSVLLEQKKSILMQKAKALNINLENQQQIAQQKEKVFQVSQELAAIIDEKNQKEKLLNIQQHQNQSKLESIKKNNIKLKKEIHLIGVQIDHIEQHIIQINNYIQDVLQKSDRVTSRFPNLQETNENENEQDKSYFQNDLTDQNITPEQSNTNNRIKNQNKSQNDQNQINSIDPSIHNNFSFGKQIEEDNLLKQ